MHIDIFEKLWLVPRGPTGPLPAKFVELAEIEPRLKSLYIQATSIVDNGSLPAFCANRTWWIGYFRPMLEALVGWDRRDEPGVDPRLTTREAFDVVHAVLYRLLPPCRGCSCAAVAGVRSFKGRRRRTCSRSAVKEVSR